MPSPLMIAGKQYKAQLDTLSGDGKVTYWDVAKTVKDAKTNPFTLTEAYYLQGWSLQNKDQFTPAAQARMERFFREEAKALTVLHPREAPTANLGWDAQPAVADDDTSKLTYKPLTGPLVNNGFNVSDPVQGQLGDCYFLGSMSAVAHVRPEVLQNMIRQNEDGSYTVTFQDRGEDYSQPPVPVEVRVTADVPTSWSSRPAYVGDAERDEIWPMILEKAFAKWKGGYESIQGGLGTQALSALTGQSPEFFQMMPDANPAEVFAQIQALTQSGAVMTASSHAFVDAQVPGVVGGHLYTLMGAVEQDGEQYIQLRNPWGSREVGSDGRDDGIFLMKASDFVKAYALVEYVA